MTLSMQGLTMAFMLLSGLGMGAVFDGYRVVSNELRLPRWWLPVFDLVYWMAAAVIVYRVLYASNNGELRAYVFIGLAFGVIIYYALLSRATVAAIKWIITAVRAVIGFILKCIDVLIIKPVLLLYKLIRVILAFGAAFAVFLLKIVLQLVRPFWKLLQWLTNPISRPIIKWLKGYMLKWKIVDRIKGIHHRVSEWFSKWRRR